MGFLYRRVLFVCTGNLCRSPMAEVLLKRRLQEGKVAGVEVRSAGVAALEGRPASEGTLRILRALGLDGSAHRSRPLTAELVDWADLILVMEAAHQMAVAARFPRAVGRVHTLKRFAGGAGDVPDPMGLDDRTYDALARDLQEAAGRILKKIQEGGDS